MHIESCFSLLPRGEYFYFCTSPGSCEKNSCTVMFKFGCFVQKYWSGTVTRNRVMDLMEKGNSNGPSNHGKESKTMTNVIQCRFSEVLFQLCTEKKTFLGSLCRNITSMCRDIAFLSFVQTCVI